MKFNGYLPVRRTPLLSRRSVLRGAGGVALALPYLEAMEGRANAAVPQRFVLVYQQQGMFMNDWQPKLRSGLPTGAEYAATDYDMPNLTTELGALKDDLLFITGLDNKTSPVDGAGNEHESVFNHLLTGKRRTKEGFFQGGGPSVDQVISTRIYGASTPRTRTMHLGPSSSWSVCYSARNAPVSRESDASEIVKSLFAGISTGTSGPDPVLEKQRVRKQRLLDAVKQSSEQLRGKLGAADRVRVDSYLNDVGELSNSFGNVSGAVSASCGKPTISSGAGWEARMSNLGSATAMALACDLTRVVTIDLGGIDSYPSARRPDGKPLPPPGLDWHQEVVHRAFQKPGEFGGTVANIAEAKQNFAGATRFTMGEFAKFIGKIKAVREADGTSLLDNTAILYVNEFGEETHGFKNYPFLIAGKLGGKIKTGRWLRYPGVSHQRLLLSMLSLYMPTSDSAYTSFGDPDWNAGGPLAGIG